jgi:methyl-accepting chemotaxis protein
MFLRTNTDDAAAKLAALEKSQAIIEFNMDGTIITANENFLKAVGYSLDEIRGKHHSMFVEADERASADYKEFWSRLNRGEFQTKEYKRIGKGGREFWIQASYNPILNGRGTPIKVVKFASDITARKIRDLENEGQMSAISRSQAVISFALDGTILNANKNFLDAVGYSLSEIEGKHHSMFVDAAERNATAYREFWESLRRGEFKSGEFKRLGKGGKEIWILATYNPIKDEKGKPFKVVKFASNITREKMRSADLDGQITAIGKSQAVIEFNMDGTIINANANFLGTVGYALSEIKGKHHSIFVAPTERGSAAYQEFWASLNRGEYKAGEFRRIGKGGKEIWIQASYNPILDTSGKPFKVVKYASDTTEQALTRLRAERARSLIESVAAGSEEMNASIREISETMTKSRQTATNAVTQVETADVQAQRLSAAARSMEGIVGLIGDITGQINLLALNATIESARAGEAGRGFAVVAGEVKNLANQAKQATDKITAEIESLNSISGDVVSALSAIRAAIDGVNEFVASTAAAVEEQSAVTTDMSNNMQRAAAELAG